MRSPVTLWLQFATFGLEQRRGLSDRHRFRRRADFESHVDSQRACDFRRKSLPDICLETRHGYRYFVGSRRELRKCVIAGVRALCRVSSAGLDVPCFNCGGDNHRPRRIADRTGDSPAISLTEDYARNQEQTSNYKESFSWHSVHRRHPTAAGLQPDFPLRLQRRVNIHLRRAGSNVPDLINGAGIKRFASDGFTSPLAARLEPFPDED